MPIAKSEGLRYNMGNGSEKTPCPICRKQMDYWERYPLMVCHECAGKTTDEEGIAIAFYSTDYFGTGCEALHRSNREKYESEICFIDGIKCKAEEGCFGGIVIQVVKSFSE
ncbi:MAG: hypothetical protein JW995_11990 [Melioribacteraceae bacterium]|nr:hypothetical protein [Melioribacteraceae bacterium]